MSASTSTAPHVPGLAAWLRCASGDDRADDMSTAQAAAISSHADIDADLGYMDGGWCGSSDYSDIDDPLAPAHGPHPAFDQLQVMPAEACTDLGADTSTPRMSLLRRMHISLVERRLDIVRDEHDRYSYAGVIGPIYHRNSLVAQISLMKRIRELRGLQ